MGKETCYEAVIVNPDPRKCSLAITGVIRDFEKRNYRLHIAISPLKNYERFEWFIEKSVEIGVDEITPLICSNTEKPGIKRERINNLIISAMKQSLKSTLTILNEPCQFNDFITNSHAGNRMIAHCNNELSRSKIGEVYSKGNDAVLLIGPEGDFSKEEISAAADNCRLPTCSSWPEPAKNRNSRHCCLLFHILHQPVSKIITWPGNSLPRLFFSWAHCKIP